MKKLIVRLRLLSFNAFSAEKLPKVLMVSKIPARGIKYAIGEKKCLFVHTKSNQNLYTHASL